MANDINSVILVGRLTRDSELKYTNGGCAVASMSVAVNERVKKGDNWEDYTNFFDVTLYGRSAESLNQYLKKGTRIVVDGKLRQSRWQQDGQNRSKVEIIANSIQLLGGNHDSNQNEYNANGNKNQVNPTYGNQKEDIEFF